jgi:hypothetical protein
VEQLKQIEIKDLARRQDSKPVLTEIEEESFSLIHKIHNPIVVDFLSKNLIHLHIPSLSRHDTQANLIHSNKIVQ